MTCKPYSKLLCLLADIFQGRGRLAVDVLIIFATLIINDFICSDALFVANLIQRG